MARTAIISAAYETRYTRHPLPEQTTPRLLADAFLGAITEAGVSIGGVDGLGVSSFGLEPDHVIDLAAKFGLSPRWLMQDPLGGASGINLLQHAVRAIEGGDANTIVLVAGDNQHGGGFSRLANNYNVATRDHLAPLDFGGPNSLFAMVTQRHMAATGLTASDYAQVSLAQRRWAGRNSGAVYRSALTLDEYLSSPVVTTPLHRYDCVPIVAGADAIVVTRHTGGPGVRIAALAALHNPDQHNGNGLSNGHRTFRDALWAQSGFTPEDVDVIGVYDDYPVMVIAQLVDLGFAPENDLAGFLHGPLAHGLPVNTSGGQLSCGQAGAAGGMHFLVEAVRQLLNRAGGHQICGARRALVSGYGMTLYRYGACANAVALEAV